MIWFHDLTVKTGFHGLDCTIWSFRDWVHGLVGFMEFLGLGFSRFASHTVLDSHLIFALSDLKFQRLLFRG